MATEQTERTTTRARPDQLAGDEAGAAAVATTDDEPARGDAAAGRGAVLAVDEADGVLDELQAWFLTRAEREGWVYTSVLRQLVNSLYRDRDYLERRKGRGRKTAYDYAVERDMKATSWAIRALVRHVPPQEKRRAEPPKPPRKPRQRLTATEKERYAGRPSWNGKPKRDWDGPDLPPHEL